MGGCGGPVEEGVDDFLTCTRFPGYMWVDCSDDNRMLEEATAGNFHVSVNDRQLEDDTTAASGNSPYAVFIAVDSNSNYPVGTKVGLLDKNKHPISRNDVGGDVTCVQVGDGVLPDDVHYFITWVGGFIPKNANCADIGNSNNAKCDLLNLPKNACVIVV